MAKGKLRRLKALVVKEFFQMIRDPSSFLIGIMMPLILMFLYGYGISLDINHLRIGLVLEDTSPDALSFAQMLTDSKYFDVTIGRDRREFDDLITSGEIRGIVIIPAWFSQFRLRPETHAQIMAIGDGSEPNTAAFVVNYVTAAFQDWLVIENISAKLQGLPLVQGQTRFWYNPQLESRYFLIPGSLAIIMTLIGTLLTALVVSREWERGTMEALMSTPVTIGEIIVGKIIPYFILGMISMTICTLMAVWAYGVPFRGSYWVLTLVSAVFLYSALGVGLLISSSARNQFVAAQGALASSFLPAVILSGFVFEISTMPWPIRTITKIIPAKYYISSLQTLFLVGDNWPLILACLWPMLLIGLILSFITIWKSVKRLD